VVSPKKVSQLKSDAASMTQYLHGDTSLEGVLVGLAQDFVGTNNLPLLQREGTFGNRLIPAAAAGRYIFTCKEPYLDKIFKKEDDPILIEQVFEGDVIEPKYYVPIIPLLVINGSIGLTTGFNQKILPHSLEDVLTYIENKLAGKKKNIELIPSFKGFEGTVTKNKKKDDNCSWLVCGKYSKISSIKIEINEVPPSYSLEEYLAELDKLEDAKKIKEYQDLSEDGKFKIEVTLFRNQGLTVDTPNLLTELKLVDSITENYTSLNENNKVIEYKSIYEIIDNYYNIRLKYYDLRKNYLIKELSKRIIETYSKYLFIKGVIDGDIIISNKSDEVIINQLEKIEKIIKVNDSYDYLLNMPMKSITKANYEKLKTNIKEMKDELTNLKNITNIEMWKNDLNDLKKALKK
jgi:DNA topoisomerase-2